MTGPRTPLGWHLLTALAFVVGAVALLWYALVSAAGAAWRWVMDR